jgi:formate-dependent nitrite reductase membrane component NrfD
MIAGGDAWTLRALALTLGFAAVAHGLILVLEHFLTPSPTLNHELAVRAVRYGAYRQWFWIGALGLGVVVPIASIGLAATVGYSLLILVPTALVTLAGSAAWEYVWVDAGQSVPNS